MNLNVFLKFVSLVFVLSIFGGVIVPVQAAPEYAWEVMSQYEGTHMNLHVGPISGNVSNAVGTIRMTLRNTGTKTWYRCTAGQPRFRLATVNPLDNQPAYSMQNIIDGVSDCGGGIMSAENNNRLSFRAAEVIPGTDAFFILPMAAYSLSRIIQSGVYTLELGIVLDGVGAKWISTEPIVSFKITINDEYGNPPPPLMLLPTPREPGVIDNANHGYESFSTPFKFEKVYQSGVVEDGVHILEATPGKEYGLILRLKNRSKDPRSLVMYGKSDLLPEKYPFQGGHELRIGTDRPRDNIPTWIDSSSFIYNPDGDNNRFVVYDGSPKGPGEDLEFVIDIKIAENAQDGDYDLYVSMVREFDAWAQQVDKWGRVIDPGNIMWKIKIRSLTEYNGNVAYFRPSNDDKWEYESSKNTADAGEAFYQFRHINNHEVILQAFFDRNSLVIDDLNSLFEGVYPLLTLHPDIFAGQTYDLNWYKTSPTTYVSWPDNLREGPLDYPLAGNRFTQAISHNLEGFSNYLDVKVAMTYPGVELNEEYENDFLNFVSSMKIDITDM